MEKQTMLEIKTGLKMRKPVYEVFEAIVDPAKMSNYFIASGSARMEEGKTVNWKFPEMDMIFPVRIVKVEKDKYISYYWGDPAAEGETLVEITLRQMDDGTTFVNVME